jgi:conjugal transfer ATP-binding protein TraC
MKTSNLADLVPIYGEWRGHEEPRILLRSRKGSLVAFDPFSSELTNYNQIISGGSGSGKSFLCSLLLMQIMKELPKIFIIDIGGSYKKICETFNGEYIMLSPGSGISINPFDLAPGEKKPSDQKIKLLLGLVEIMTKETEANSLGKLERSLLEESIMKVYEDHELPRLTHLMNALISHTSPEMQKLGKILKMWCGDTPYGKFLDTPTQINLENSLISFDLKGLGNYPDLQSVCLFVLTDLIWRAVQKDQTSMKFLLLDECWKLIENDTGSIFIAEIFRTFRKYRASCIAISQNIDDFAASKISTAILSNAATKWILKQKGAKQERLKEVLQLNDTEMALVESIEQVKGSYSEAFLMAGDHKSLIQVESTPLEYWLATTDPKDIQLSEKIQMENPGLKDFDLFTLLAARYPNGAFGPKES